MLADKIVYLFLFAVCAATGNFEIAVTSVSWDNCGSGENALLKTLSISPDPIILPGNVTFDAEGESTIDAISPIAVKLTIKRKVAFVWIDIPCTEEVGSCEYSDVCTFLDQIFTGQCPPFFGMYNIPCHCPFAKGDYKISSFTVDIPRDPLPSFLADGQYKIKAEATTNGTPFACVDLSLTISSPSVSLLQQ